MSDLAPFVAAALRDKVVAELYEENRALTSQLERERTYSQSVAITGPRGSPIYAKALFQDGNYDYSSPELWKVEFPYEYDDDDDERPFSCCSVSELAEMEVRIGGVCKARLAHGDGIGDVEGFVNDVKNNYDHVQQSGAVSIWFGGSSGIWLNIQIQPIGREQYAALRDFDLGGDTFLSTLLQFASPDAKVSYTEVSFLISYVNGAMENWGIDVDRVVEEEEEEA
jgi:hypothetical protein